MFTIEEMRERKRRLGLSIEMLAERSGIPASTVQKVLAGATKSPRRKTLEALSEALSEPVSSERRGGPSFPDAPGPMMIGEPSAAYGVGPGRHTIEDIEALPEGVYAELIDGQMYFMAAPRTVHQRIVGRLFVKIANYIEEHGGDCEAFPSPYGVYLNADDSVFVIPDLTVTCDPSKITEKGVMGAPDWIIEVVSPSSRKMDGIMKPDLFRRAGVREYWIIHPEKRIIQVYQFGEEEDVRLYAFEEEVPAGICEDLTIRLADMI